MLGGCVGSDKIDNPIANKNFNYPSSLVELMENPGKFSRRILTDHSIRIAGYGFIRELYYDGDLPSELNNTKYLRYTVIKLVCNNAVMDPTLGIVDYKKGSRLDYFDYKQGKYISAKPGDTVPVPSLELCKHLKPSGEIIPNIPKSDILN